MDVPVAPRGSRTDAVVGVVPRSPSAVEALPVDAGPSGGGRSRGRPRPLTMVPGCPAVTVVAPPTSSCVNRIVQAADRADMERPRRGRGAGIRRPGHWGCSAPDGTRRSGPPPGPDGSPTHLGDRVRAHGRRAPVRPDGGAHGRRRTSVGDPRFAIHGPTFHPEEGHEGDWPGEAKIAGRAVPAGPLAGGVPDR